MSITRYKSTLDDFVPTTFNNLIDRFLNDTISRAGGAALSFVPKADIAEHDKAYEIQIAVPGLNKEDIKIDLNENVLTISGERKLNKEQKEKNFHALETQYGAFSRSFVLPEHIDATHINAKYDNGILEIIVPKDEKKTLKTTIKVN